MSRLPADVISFQADVIKALGHPLRIEIVNTDDREFRRSLKEREAFMKELIERLKS